MRRRFDVDEFERMAAAGIFGEGERVELIRGEIVESTPPNPPHEGTVNRLTHLFVTRFGDRCIVHVQNTLRLDRHSQVMPDLVLLRRRDDFYSGRRALPPDALLTIEVAESSLRTDLRIKVPLYAATGVAEVWVVDVRRREIHRFADPTGNEYSITSVHGREQTIPLPFGDGEIAVADLVG